MATITANFETGTNGNTISSGDAGSATAWNSVTIGANATCTYDNSNPAHGTLAGKYSNGASAVNTYTTWSTAWGTQTDHYGSMNFNFSANPSSDTLFWCCIGGGLRQAGLAISSTGKIEVVDGAGATTAGTVTLSANTWYRVEYHAIHSTTIGRIVASVFTLDGAVAVDSVIRTGVNTGASTTSARYGAAVVGTIANWTIELDDIVALDTSMTWPKGSGTRYDVAGTYNWKAPYTINPATVTTSLWGAGGGGGGSVHLDSLAGSGGGGGGFSQSIPSVTPGTSYTIILGAGGLASVSSGNGGNGANSTWQSTTIVANAGTGGQGDGGTAGTGGAAGTGTTKTAGGNGGTGGAGNGGGGGGSGGSTGNGGNASAGTGGTAGSGSPAGAAGPNGNTGAGAAGNAPGSGAAGGGYSGTTDHDGGRGADGSGTLTWTADKGGILPVM